MTGLWSIGTMLSGAGGRHPRALRRQGDDFGAVAAMLIDPTVERELQSRTPLTRAWLESIRRGDHAGCDGDLALPDSSRPLLKFVMDSFVPLMQQNEQAWIDARARGQTRFNEHAFDVTGCSMQE